jgi:hypothetical protein
MNESLIANSIFAAPAKISGGERELILLRVHRDVRFIYHGE